MTFIPPPRGKTFLSPRARNRPKRRRGLAPPRAPPSPFYSEARTPRRIRHAYAPRRRRAIRDWIDRRRSDSDSGGGGLVGCVLALVLVLVLVGCVLALPRQYPRSYSFDARTFVNPARLLVDLLELVVVAVDQPPVSSPRRSRPRRCDPSAAFDSSPSSRACRSSRIPPPVERGAPADAPPKLGHLLLVVVALLVALQAVQVLGPASFLPLTADLADLRVGRGVIERGSVFFVVLIGGIVRLSSEESSFPFRLGRPMRARVLIIVVVVAVVVSGARYASRWCLLASKRLRGGLM